MKGQNHDGKSKVTAQFPHEEALCIRISAKWTVPDRDVGLKARARQTALQLLRTAPEFEKKWRFPQNPLETKMLFPLWSALGCEGTTKVIYPNCYKH